MPDRTLTRRTFLMGSAVAVAGCAASPRVARRISPNERLNVASVGAGGRASGHIMRAGQTENVVALCDVDEQTAKNMFNRFVPARKYADYREMFDEMAGEIDAVIVATPDHHHAPAAMAAIELGIHVYCEKPLTYSVAESRALARAAARYGVVTHMGNQGNSSDDVRRSCEMIWDGAIGAVREVHCWSDRPGSYWAYGGGAPLPEKPIPPTMAWDLWLGPAPVRPYNPGYAPDDWRGWWDFGCGALGDMGCHIMDTPNWTLLLTAPERVEVVDQEGTTEQCCPKRCTLKYSFPERRAGTYIPALGKELDRTLPPVTLYWYDGGNMPDFPEDIPAEELPGSNGSLLVGEKGYLVAGGNGQDSRLAPAARFADYKAPDPYLPRVPGGQDFNAAHRDVWLAACKSGEKTSADFAYAGPFTEWVLLGNAALRAGEPIEWDSGRMRIKSMRDDERLISRVYRDGWRV